MAAEQSEPRSPLEIVSDEDWKQRVKAEDAALDEKLKDDAAAAKTSTTEQGTAADRAHAPIDAGAIPPADFPTLVSMFSTQAMVALGLLPNPAAEKSERQLPLARHFIDLLGVLEEKTKGNLNDGEQNLLESSLHQLRMLYVEMVKQSQ